MITAGIVGLIIAASAGGLAFYKSRKNKAANAAAQAQANAAAPSAVQQAKQ